MMAGYGNPYNTGVGGNNYGNQMGTSGGYAAGGSTDYNQQQPYGGGYLQQQQQQHLSQPTGSFDSPSGKKKASTNQSLRPVTCKQLNEASQAYADAPFMVDGQELGQVTIVGCIVKMNEQSTNLALQIDDGTGVVDVRMWFEDSDSDFMAQKRAALRENVYVRATGHFRSFNQKRHLGAFNIRPIIDFNEITYHNLEAIYCHLYFTRGPIGRSAKDQQQQQQSSGAYVPHALGANQSNYGEYSRNDGGANDYGNQFTPLQSRIIDAIRQNGRGHEGISIHFLFRLMASEPQSAIQQSVDWLVGEGHLYGTIDDHFQVTSL